AAPAPAGLGLGNLHNGLGDRLISGVRDHPGDSATGRLSLGRCLKKQNCCKNRPRVQSRPLFGQAGASARAARNPSGAQHEVNQTMIGLGPRTRSISGPVIKVVASAMMTIMENRAGEMMCRSSPTLRMTSSTSPLVFTRTPTARDSRQGMPLARTHTA